MEFLFAYPNIFLILVLAILISFFCLLLYCVFNYVKNKNSLILKKMVIPLILLGILLYLAYPFCLIYKSTKDTDNARRLLEKAYKLSVIPILKGTASAMLEIVTFSEIDKKYNYKTFSSPEAQKLISENIMWTDITITLYKEARYSGLSIQMLDWGRLDDALKYYNLAKENGENVGTILVQIYIAKGEYQNAFEELNKIINKGEISFGTLRRDLYLMAAIYTGLSEFEKAHQKLDEWYEQTQNTAKYYASKFFVYKKSGDEVLAQE